MEGILLNLAAAAVVLIVVFGVWGGLHLLARKQLGDRKMGCKGPRPDGQGNMLCCRGDGTLCENPDRH